MQDGMRQKYTQLAGAYDTRWAFYLQASIGATLTRLTPAARVLDIGCGTGELLRRLCAAHVPQQLTGVDASAAMLQVARRKLPPEVRLCTGWAERLPFAAAQFDLVVSCNMFHYIAMPAAALAECRRVLRPGGRLVITDWCDDYAACRLCSRLLRLFGGERIRVYGGEQCVRMLQDAGYAATAADRYKINWLWGLMTVCAVR